jgi:hypothetical protein
MLVLTDETVTSKIPSFLMLDAMWNLQHGTPLTFHLVSDLATINCCSTAPEILPVPDTVSVSN